MEWDEIPVRRSARLQQDPGPSTTPTSPPSSSDEEGVVPLQIQDLPDMGPGVEIFDLPDTKIGFNEDYLTSQE